MTRIAINGYGRIGRCILRALFEAQQQGRLAELEIVAVNELADCNTIAHLTQYDSTHGRFPAAVSIEQDTLLLGQQRVHILHREDIRQLPWAALNIDLVLECTGAFNDRATAELHLQAGAGHVLFSQPATAEVDATVVYGVNQQQLSGTEQVVSNASCTTNCIVPVIAALDSALGIESGVITTIHSAMNDQPVIDAYHHTDLRKTRSAIQSMIPVDTGLARGIERLLPELGGRFEAQAMRVPTVNVSAMDLSVVVAKATSASEVNQILRLAANTQFDGVLGYTEELLASCDYNHDPRSGVVDATQTRVAGAKLVKVLTWFDNEWGYANRMLDTAAHWAEKF
ncbi:MAG: erythrose-4-phosphate dehydrogenase [Cellvibrionaceae bacterium]|nr:erythrose-4-phosphate dehydrogenase [Cellvibrionaceae bacterium]